MLGDDKDYSFFVTILLIAIAVSLAFHIFFKQNVEASFSEIYFPDPDNLPNEVALNQKYNFSFQIKNDEGKPSTYDYNTTLELFNLYDVTEGIYKCVAQQRKKVLLKWAYSNETNYSLPESSPITGYAVYSPASQSPDTFIFSISDDYGKIDWNAYSIEYSYENLLGGGTFTTFFYGSDVKYSFKIIEDTSEVEFGYKSGNSTKYEKKKIDLNKQNHEVLINVSSNKLRYYFDKISLFNKSLEDTTDGKIGFRMDDSYIIIGKMITYKDTPIQVTSSKYIREYDIDNSLIIQKIEKYTRLSEDRLYLYRNFINYTLECKNPGCAEMKSFFNDTRTHLETSYTFNETELASLLDTGRATSLPSYSLVQNKSAPGLFWTNYTLKMNFQTFIKPHAFLVSFDHEFAIVFQNQYIYFLLKNENGTSTYRRKSFVEIGVNELVLESKGNSILVYVNQIPIFNIDKELKFNDISIYTKNTFIVFDDIILTNKECRFGAISKNCKRLYNLESERRISSADQLKIVTEPIKFSAGMALAPFLGVSNIFDVQAKNATLNNTKQQSINQLIEYEIEINQSLVNENIPSERYVFDGRNARLVNQTNYSFAFNFHLLDGVRLIETSFYDNTKTEISKFVVYQPSNEVYLFTNHKGAVVKNFANFNVSRYEGHKFEMSYEPGNTRFYIDSQKIFEIEGLDMSTGYFSISTYNTYADINEIRIYDLSLKRFIPYTINEDPCKLRKIDEMPLGKDSIFLDNGENTTIYKNFSISRDFDYGMVSAVLKQENRNDSEVHFWMVRSD